MNEAVSKLRSELKQFHLFGLEHLKEDLELGRNIPDYIPTRGTWKGCPLSYRNGYRGSVCEDSDGHSLNDFTVSWDGISGDYMDEMVVLIEVKRELGRRERKQRRRHRPQTRRQV